MTKNVKSLRVESDNLIKDGKVVLSVGSTLFEQFNKFREFKVVSIDLHFIGLEKITVGEFEQQEIGKGAERQTSHFLNGTSGLVLAG